MVDDLLHLEGVLAGLFAQAVDGVALRERLDDAYAECVVRLWVAVRRDGDGDHDRVRQQRRRGPGGADQPDRRQPRLPAPVKASNVTGPSPASSVSWAVVSASPSGTTVPPAYRVRYAAGVRARSRNGPYCAWVSGSTTPPGHETRASGRPSGSTSSTAPTERASAATGSGSVRVTGPPGWLNAASSPSAPLVSSSRSSSSTGVGQCCGTGGVGTGCILSGSPYLVRASTRGRRRGRPLRLRQGHHHGSVVALAADGTTAWSVGEVTGPVLPRSCNKPLQALGMVRLGLDLPPELLALACASHSGEPFHLDGVRRILALGDLDVDALQTPRDYPLDDDAKVAAIRAAGASSLAMNCSGKHAAMLLTCVVNSWDTATYLSPDHPLQQASPRPSPS